MIKGRSSAKLDLPTEGTIKRFVYDYLYEKRGEEIPLEDYEALYALARGGNKSSSSMKNILDELRNYWGCDIRADGLKRITLIGEWCGRVYLDYTGPAEERASRPVEVDGAFLARHG